MVTRRGLSFGAMLPARPGLAAVALAIALGAIAYGRSLPYPYVQDAVPAVQLNPVVERGDWREIFLRDYWADTGSPARSLYRPMTVASFALERRLAGAATPRISRAVNLLLHLLVALSLFRLLVRVGAGPTAARAAGLLFVVHPVFLQVVVNIVGRADLLGALGTLAALVFLTHAGPWAGNDAPSPGRSRIAAWAAAACLFMALGAKEVAFAAPLLILALELLFRGPGRARGGWVPFLARLAPCGLALLVFLVLRTLAIEAFPGLQRVPAQDNLLVGLEGLPQLATTLAMAGRYGALLLFPRALSADYSGTAIAREDSLWGVYPLVGIGLLALALGTAVAAWRARNSPVGRARAVAALLFLVPYLFVGNLLVLNAAGFAERLIYLPAAGFCAGIGILYAAAATALRTAVARRALAASGLAVLFVVAVHTALQARMWRSLDELYTHALATNPRAALAHFGLAELRKSSGRRAEALTLYEDGVRVVPESAELQEGLGRLLREQGDLARAEPALRRAIEADPTLPRAHYQLGMVLRASGRGIEAERAFRRALLLNPRLVGAGEALAEMASAAGRWDEAVRYYRGCVALGRRDLEREFRRAEALAAQTRHEPAGP